jgi:hypothetical protein
MTRGISLLGVLLLATSAVAVEPKKSDDAKPPTAAETAREKMERLRAAKRGAGGGATKGPAAQAPAGNDRATAMRAKSVYVYAVEACEQPARCDAALRDDAETKFMEACRACAPDDRCEQEREAIKGGRAKRSANPCAP